MLVNDMYKSRKEIIQRRQTGRTLLPVWVRKMEGICRKRITAADFIGLEETEFLRDSFFDKVRNSDQSLFYLKKDFNKITRQLKAIEKQLGSQSIILFHSNDKFIGALRVNSHCVLENVEKVWALVEEDFSIATEDLKSGLCLEENYYDREGNFFPDGLYELTIWGWSGQRDCPSSQND